MTHRIHGAGIYANIGGIFMGSMLPYIAPWILWAMDPPPKRRFLDLTAPPLTAHLPCSGKFGSMAGNYAVNQQRPLQRLNENRGPRGEIINKNMDEIMAELEHTVNIMEIEIVVV